jgi:hypothetical protein
MTRSCRSARIPAPARRGSAYIAVLGLSMLVTTIGLGAMLAIRSQRRTADLQNYESDARAAAAGAIDLAAVSLAKQPTWRSSYANDTYTSTKALGAAGISFKLVDEHDADLADSAIDAVRVYGAGSAGDATRIASVVLRPSGTALPLLGLPVYSAGDITVSGTALASGGPIAAGGTCTISLLARLKGDAECQVLLNLGVVEGSARAGVPARVLPLGSLYDSYCASATTIPFGSIPSSTIQRVVLSAASNPYGSTNPAGCYFIDVPALGTLTISQSRLAATLVVNLGLSATLTISGANAWDPPSVDSPTLIVRSAGLLGTVNIQGSLTPLSEVTAGTNFNPPSTPYFGISNATSTDTFPSEVRGVVHIIGGTLSTNIGSSAVVRGCIISDASIALSGGAHVIADPGILAVPPDCYITPTGLVMDHSTWRREQDN